MSFESLKGIFGVTVFLIAIYTVLGKAEFTRTGILKPLNYFRPKLTFREFSQ